MKTWGAKGLWIFVAVMAIASAALAGPWQGWRGSGGWGPGSTYQRMYDPATVTTLSGEVVSVDEFHPMKGMRSGIHLMVRSDGEAVSVHLGPAWYLARQDTRIEKGDRIEVKGSRVIFQDKPAIIAEEVKKGDVVLKLRNEQGIPAWSGWRRAH